MWLKEQKRFWKPICRKSSRCVIAGILIFCGILTGCEKTSKREVKKEAIEENNGWKPLTISRNEKLQAEKQVKNVLNAYQKIFPYENPKMITAKDQKKVLKNLWKAGYPAADSEEKSVMGGGKKVRDFIIKVEKGKNGEIAMVSLNPSGGFTLIQLRLEQKELLGVLTTVIWNTKREASISEMVKYKVKKLQLSKDEYLICEFYLSDQDELQAGGTMKFRLK